MYKYVPFIELWNGLVLGGLMILITPFIILLVNHKGKKTFSFYTHIILPLVFLIPTTLAGLVYLFIKYLKDNKFLSLTLVIFLFVLIVSVLAEGFRKWKTGR